MQLSPYLLYFHSKNSNIAYQLSSRHLKRIRNRSSNKEFLKKENKSGVVTHAQKREGNKRVCVKVKNKSENPNLPN